MIVETLKRWLDNLLIGVVVMGALGLSAYFFWRTEENRHWQQELAKQKQQIDEFNAQLKEENEAEQENLNRIREGKAGQALAYQITEYTGKIHPDQILFAVTDANIASLPDVAGLEEVEEYYQVRQLKPPSVTLGLGEFKAEQKALQELMPPEPVLELESLPLESERQP